MRAQLGVPVLFRLVFWSDVRLRARLGVWRGHDLGVGLGVGSGVGLGVGSGVGPGVGPGVGL